MEGADTSKRGAEVEVFGAADSFDVALGEVVFGTSSTIAVGFVTGKSTLPSDGKGLNKRRAASIMIHDLRCRGM
jgi:hypothetical protein